MKSTGIRNDPVTILLFLSLMALPVGGDFLLVIVFGIGFYQLKYLICYNGNWKGKPTAYDLRGCNTMHKRE